MGMGFRFRWVPFIATIAVVAIGIALGNWQGRRADEKRAIAARMQERKAAPLLVVGAEPANVDEIEYRHVRMRGEFDSNWPLYLDNRPQGGKPGFYLLMPFKLAGSNRHVLIERGWLPVNPGRRTELPPPVTPAGQTEVEGIAVRNPGRVFQLGQAAAIRPGAILQNVTVGEFAATSGFEMQSFVVEQSSALQDGLVRDWPVPSAGIEKHLGYRFQWYGLAATAFVFFVVTGFRRNERRNEQGNKRGNEQA
ncbi:MAG: SURF1 family protein [Burkholderiaceae bacterium]|nr:SURF1 family protein [Burkholderiaceae bacterium]